MPGRHLSHYSVAVLASFAVATFVFVLGGAIVLNYILTVNYVHHIETVQAAIQQHQHLAQQRAGVGTCLAVKQMDEARIGAVNASHDPNSYGHKLAKAIHSLYIHSGCPKLIRQFGPKHKG